MDSLAAGQCSAAVVVGTNVLATPFFMRGAVALGAVSPDGTSAPFSCTGNGFCRSEGAVALILLPEHAATPGQQAAAAALSARAYACVIGCGGSYDGRKANSAAPSPAAQQDLMERVHAQSGVPKEAVVYVEAHATGEGQTMMQADRLHCTQLWQ